MIRIAITVEAFAAIASTLALGSVGYEIVRCKARCFAISFALTKPSMYACPRLICCVCSRPSK